MNGREVWDAAVKVLPESIEAAMEESGLDVSDIKMLVPHQPSVNILKYVAEKFGMPIDKVKMVQHKYGNKFIKALQGNGVNSKKIFYPLNIY
jgi:3-oxoacyl-[acyl-carrier-protein] synthase-3